MAIAPAHTCTADVSTARSPPRSVRCTRIPARFSTAEEMRRALEAACAPGGTATFDDFHGPYEWENLVRELQRVFPDRRIVDLPATHPIFTCFYKIDAYPPILSGGEKQRAGNDRTPLERPLFRSLQVRTPRGSHAPQARSGSRG